ncbi:hypothetical protein P4S63_19565 [Pseudoalteromonas sp. B193]
MLITSLVMSLNQLLPVAILLVLLQVVKKQSALKIGSALLIGALMSFLVQTVRRGWSQWFGHQGLEYYNRAMYYYIYSRISICNKTKISGFFILLL